MQINKSKNMKVKLQLFQSFLIISEYSDISSDLVSSSELRDLFYMTK